MQCSAQPYSHLSYWVDSQMALSGLPPLIVNGAQMSPGPLRMLGSHM